MKLSFFKKHEKKLAIATSIIIILLVGGLFALKSYNEAPRDLGERLEYIGKHSNCEGTFLFCDSTPGQATYFFATDMTKEELKMYFKNASYKEKKGGSIAGDYSSEGMDFSLQNTEDRLNIDYYDNTRKVIEIFELRDTGKLYVISVASFDYPLAKDAL